MNNNAHTLVIFVGKSGSGKSSLINRLCEREGYTQLISQTTRPRRNENDNDHKFVTEEDYYMAKLNGDIVAETEINGYHYYATREQVYNADFYTLDPQGVESLLSMNLPNLRLVIIYISCPDEVRMDRAVNKRGDNKQTFRARNYSESAQFRKFIADEKWDYSVNNIDFQKAYSVIKWICDIEGLWKNRLGDTTR
jgi:guanylate kinase